MRRVSPFKNGCLIAIQNAEAIGTRLGLSPLASSLRNWRPADILPVVRPEMRSLSFSENRRVDVGRDCVGSLPPLDRWISF